MNLVLNSSQFLWTFIRRNTNANPFWPTPCKSPTNSNFYKRNFSEDFSSAISPIWMKRIYCRSNMRFRRPSKRNHFRKRYVDDALSCEFELTTPFRTIVSDRLVLSLHRTRPWWHQTFPIVLPECLAAGCERINDWLDVLLISAARYRCTRQSSSQAAGSKNTCRRRRDHYMYFGNHLRWVFNLHQLQCQNDVYYVIFFFSSKYTALVRHIPGVAGDLLVAGANSQYAPSNGSMSDMVLVGRHRIAGTLIFPSFLFDRIIGGVARLRIHYSEGEKGETGSILQLGTELPSFGRVPGAAAGRQRFE